MSSFLQLGVMDTDVSRNFFGRQVNSFEADISLSDSFLKVCPGEKTFHGVFIRAPAVVQTFSPKVEVLASLKRADMSEPVIVAVQQDNVMATAFHPELTEDVRWHQYFIERVYKNKQAMTGTWLGCSRFFNAVTSLLLLKNFYFYWKLWCVDLTRFSFISIVVSFTKMRKNTTFFFICCSYETITLSLV